MHKTLFALLLACPLLFSACGGSSKTYYYTLQPAAVPEKHAHGNIDSIAITSLKLPEIVDRPQLVLRQGDTQISIDDNHLWAQSLKSELLDSLANLLAQETGALQVMLPAQAGASDAQIKIALEITRFESIPGQEAILEAQWKIQAPGKPPLKTGYAQIRKPAAGGAAYDALVSAHRQALMQLARAIAAALLPTTP